MESTRDDWTMFMRRLSPEGDPRLVQLVWRLRRVARLAYQRGEAGLEEAGLSYAQFRVLVRLLYSEQIELREGLHPSEISRLHGINRNTVSALLQNLEQSALISRARDGADRRRYVITLTDEGRRLVQRFAPQYIKSITGIFEPLDREDVAHLLHLLQRFDVIADERQD